FYWMTFFAPGLAFLLLAITLRRLEVHGSRTRWLQTLTAATLLYSPLILPDSASEASTPTYWLWAFTVTIVFAIFVYHLARIFSIAPTAPTRIEAITPFLLRVAGAVLVLPRLALPINLRRDEAYR